ncbi:MAG: DUF2007 domain-containing protein [Planctomycetes bacterium]|nr:DUF2007 domain-containing protein [Planctomycetota bacterium]
MAPARHRRRHAQPPPETDAAPTPAAPAPAPGADYAELVLLVHADNMAEAELYRGELAAHGIPAVVEGESAAVAGIPDLGAGVPVLVPETLADEAAELIAELESSKPEDIPVEDKDVFDGETDDAEDVPVADPDELDLDDDEDEDLDDEEDEDLDDDWDDDEDWDDDDDDEEEGDE